MSRGSGGGGQSRGCNSSRGNMDKAGRDNRSNQLNPNNRAYSSSKSGNRTNSSSQPRENNGNWREMMDRISSSRIQSHADKTGSNQDFKARAQSSADKNENDSNG